MSHTGHSHATRELQRSSRTETVGIDSLARSLYMNRRMSSGPRGAHTISPLTAICIVVANMVGTGIFTSLGFQVAGIPTGFAIMAIWVAGGICALCGALSYAELGAALPRSGGAIASL